MKAYQSVFVLIRAKPEGLYYIDVLKTFEKYIDLELSIKKIVKLKNDIDQIDIIGKEYLKENLNVYTEHKSFNDVDKLKNYIYVLPVVTNQMIKLLERKEFERAHDFADAVHNLPEFLVTDFWRADKYYNNHIKPYNKKWKDTCLDELESRNTIKSYLSKLLHRN